MPAERSASGWGSYGIRPIATAREQFLLFQQFSRKFQQQQFQHYPQHFQQFLRNVEQQLRHLQQFLRNVQKHVRDIQKHLRFIVGQSGSAVAVVLPDAVARDKAAQR